MNNENIMSAVSFKTDSGNSYVHSQKVNQFLITHPLLHYILSLKNKGIDLAQWAENLNEEPVEIEGCGSFTRKEVDYYLQKYELLSGNGYLDSMDIPDVIKSRLTAADVKFALTNTAQVTFEVTEACNFKCEYCGFGKFYKKSKRSRHDQDLSFSAAARLLDYLAELWNSNLNASHRKLLHISFFGGEPLVNFPLIKKIVEYSKTIKLRHNYFEYGITTNGALLDKYMDFLAENNFLLLISLDGPAESNSYRVFQDGKASYQTVLSNTKQLRAAYPDYFKRKVNFSVVLHNRNSVAGIHRFFKEEFDKSPNVAEVNVEGIDPEFKEEFWKTYKNFRESAAKADNYSVLEADIFDKLPEFRESIRMICQYGGFAYKKSSGLVFQKQNKSFIPTSTCLPFGRKIFLSAAGKILTCERISHNYDLGYVDENEVRLDFGHIAQKYNAYYDKIRQLCNTCFKVKNCGQCIFNMDIESENPTCYGRMDSLQFSKYLAENISVFENKPGIYDRFMKEVIIV